MEKQRNREADSRKGHWTRNTAFSVSVAVYFRLSMSLASHADTLTEQEIHERTGFSGSRARAANALALDPTMHYRSLPLASSSSIRFLIPSSASSKYSAWPLSCSSSCSAVTVGANGAT